MTETKSTGYIAFLGQILSWAKECVALIRFKKAWEKGRVPREEMGAKALNTEEADQKLVEEIFHADLHGHAPSLDVQIESTKKLVEELENPEPAWPEPRIQVFGETNGKSKKKETPQVALESAQPSHEESLEEVAGGETPALIQASVPENSATEVTHEETTPSFPHRPTILVIDDYKPLRRMIQKALHGAFYNVCTAEDGVEGIVRVHDNDVDVVVCDVQMPRLDGFEMSKMLNVRDSTREIPIIFLTEILDDQTKSVAKRLGAADTLIKPFTMDALFDSIEMVLASHQVSADQKSPQEVEPTLAVAQG